MAKPLNGTYQPDKRTMFEIKHQRTADCVVAGYRVHKSGPDSIGSLLLGLYKEDGELANVGVIGAFPAARRKELFTELQPWSRPSTTSPGTGRSWLKASDAHEVRSSAGGTLGRISPLCRCARNSSWKCGTSTWRATASTHRPVQPLAPRPRSTLLHLRAARRAREVRPRRHSFRATMIDTDAIGGRDSAYDT